MSRSSRLWSLLLCNFLAAAGPTGLFHTHEDLFLYSPPRAGSKTPSRYDVGLWLRYCQDNSLLPVFQPHPKKRIGSDLPGETGGSRSSWDETHHFHWYLVVSPLVPVPAEAFEELGPLLRSLPFERPLTAHCSSLPQALMENGERNMSQLHQPCGNTRSLRP